MTAFDPSSTIITRVNKQMGKPIVPWAIIITLVGSIISGATYIGELRAGINQATAKDAANHLAAMEAVGHEEDMRMLTSNNVSENVDEVKEDLKEMNKRMLEESKETQRLLRELIQRQSATQ